ncbi:MBL fold metallo-hydrolase [Candidatus Fermentibacteria bacterium]|nr:MBL fold metallo-hydrolase [Candidatus Fermentibacteria bacterium]
MIFISTVWAIAAAVGTRTAGNVTVTVVFDNYAYDQLMTTSWGFGALLTTETDTVLFDTGGNGDVLLHNLGVLGVDPASIGCVVLSHRHHDHIGGLSALIEAGSRPRVYVLEDFPDVLLRFDNVVVVDSAMQVRPGIRTTGPVRAGLLEQALVVSTPDGDLVLTGCAHPGVENMVQNALDSGSGEILLVMGGFHLGGASPARIRATAERLQEQGVKKVAPSHCSGDEARRVFEELFGEDCCRTGAGWRFEP